MTPHDAVELGKQLSLLWRHNGRGNVSNHQRHDCLLNRLFRRRSKKTSKLRVTGFCVGNSPGTGEFPAQMASNAENVSIWWRLHVRVMACRLFDAKLKTNQCSLITNQTPQGTNLMKFESKYKYFHSRNCIGKYRLFNGGHFVRASECS